jgi:hypothetical protein
MVQGDVSEVRARLLGNFVAEQGRSDAGAAMRWSPSAS